MRSGPRVLMSQRDGHRGAEAPTRTEIPPTHTILAPMSSATLVVSTPLVVSDFLPPAQSGALAVCFTLAHASPGQCAPSNFDAPVALRPVRE